MQNNGQQMMQAADVIVKAIDRLQKTNTSYELGEAATKDVANNLTETDEGYVLDARQGKALNDKIADKFYNSRITSVSDLTTYFATNKIGICRAGTSLGNALSGHSRQGIVIGFEISEEYDGYIFLDSNGDTYSGWITVATSAVTYHQL